MRISSRFSLGFVLPRRKFRFVHFATYERRKTDEGQQAFEGTIATTHELLDLYVRLSSQAEHTSQLILDGRWEGVSKVRPLLPPPRILILISSVGHRVVGCEGGRGGS